MSNDVDIIISHGDPAIVVNLCGKLVDRLQTSGAFIKLSELLTSV